MFYCLRHKQDRHFQDSARKWCCYRHRRGALLLLKYHHCGICTRRKSKCCQRPTQKENWRECGFGHEVHRYIPTVDPWRRRKEWVCILSATMVPRIPRTWKLEVTFPTPRSSKFWWLFARRDVHRCVPTVDPCRRRRSMPSTMIPRIPLIWKLDLYE